MGCIFELVRDQQTHSVSSTQTVLDVARIMVEKNIGAVPVLTDGVLVGIFSERDLMKRVVVEGRDPSKTLVSEVMTDEPLTVEPHTTMDDCRQLMHRHGFRHLPVCEGRKLRGVVSLRDIVLHDLDERDGEVRMMRAYIQSEI